MLGKNICGKELYSYGPVSVILVDNKLIDLAEFIYNIPFIKNRVRDKQK